MAGAAVAGSVLSRTADAMWAKSQNKLAWSRTKRLHQKRHQWEVADLIKAGLNPILSAGSAPGIGSPPQASGSDMGGAADAIQRQTQEQAQRKNLRSQRGQIAVAIRLAEAQILKETSASDLNTANAASVRAQTARYKPVSDVGGMFGRATGSISSGDAYQGFQTIMGGNADEAKKAAKRLKDWLNKIARQKMQERNRNSNY